MLLGCSKNTAREKTSISTSEESLVNGASENSGNRENVLLSYSDDQIEYARVWLNLGSNQNIDELKILLLPAGSLVIPNDKNSAVYP